MNINRKLKIFRCALQSGTTPFASVFVTRKCNLACEFCHSRKAEDSRDLSTAEWKTAIDRLYRMGVRNLSFNGGEPLLRPDIAELVEYASKDKGCVTWLFSNALLLDDTRLKKLRSLDFLCASLNGVDIHDTPAVRAFLDSLRRCEKQGITPALLLVLTQDNLDLAYGIAEACVERNILFDFGLLQTMGGRFSGSTGPEKAEPARLRPLFRKLADLRAKTGKILPSYKLLKKAADFYEKNNWKCPRESNPFIVVDNDGTLMPCQEYGSTISIFDVDRLSDERWVKAKKKIVAECPGCSWTCYYQKTFRNPFDLLQETVVLLKF